jgi:U4/U6 small nuclear ribonucleoprotein PRP3
MDADHLDLTGLENIITPYVQHPVPIKSPGEPTAQPPRQLMLTKRESKKLRRQKRLEAQKDKQDKIRLGLLPPEQPKGMLIFSWLFYEIGVSINFIVLQ